MNEPATTGVDPCLVMPVRVGCVCACFTCLPDSLPTFMQSSRYSAGSKKANAVSAAKPVVPNFATQGGASGMNFAWPGENNDTKESKGTANDSNAKTQKMESSSGSGSESSSSSGAGSQSSDSEN